MYGAWLGNNSRCRAETGKTLGWKPTKTQNDFPECVRQEVEVIVASLFDKDLDKECQYTIPMTAWTTAYLTQFLGYEIRCISVHFFDTKDDYAFTRKQTSCR